MATLAILAVIMAVFPTDGVKLGEYGTIEFPTLAEYLQPDTTPQKDINSILKNLASADTVVSDKTEEPQQDLSSRSDSLRKMALQLQYKDNDPAAMAKFFAALEHLASDPKAIRILHFGDSQIEGDRMTSLIRARLQGRFGGIGAGLVAPVLLAPSFSVDISVEGPWKRYPGYGARDTSVHHNRYGVLATFCRFTPNRLDTTEEAAVQEASVTFKKAGRAFQGAKEFSQIRMLYGYNRKPVWYRVEVDGTELESGELDPSQSMKTKLWSFSTKPEEVRIEFRGVDSPDFFGFSLEGPTGVVVDNVPMRGASGTVFGAVEYGSLAGAIQQLNTKLIILQYGGNTVPYIADRDHAFRYGRSLGSQIRILQKMAPDASFVVIGPADMGYNDQGTWVTHPQVENVRDAVRQAAHENGAAFFDIYEAMGGRNSMAAWVEADPPLAAKDYVHFSPKGAMEIAEAFIRALLRDFDAWKKTAPASPPPTKSKKDKSKMTDLKDVPPVNPSKPQNKNTDPS